MKIEKIKEESYYNSQKTSEAILSLALAGIAIIWLFKATTSNGIQINRLLFWGLITFIISIFLGIIQYSTLAITWSLHYSKEYKKQLKKGNRDIDNIDVKMPHSSSLFAWVLFSVKILLLLTGYILVFVNLAKILDVK